MLVLRRKKREFVVIDVADNEGDPENQITIIVGQVTNGAVKLCIDAPRHMVIRRGELKPHDNPPSIPGD